MNAVIEAQTRENNYKLNFFSQTKHMGAYVVGTQKNRLNKTDHTTRMFRRADKFSKRRNYTFSGSMV